MWTLISSSTFSIALVVTAALAQGCTSAVDDAQEENVAPAAQLGEGTIRPRDSFQQQIYDQCVRTATICQVQCTQEKTLASLQGRTVNCTCNTNCGSPPPPPPPSPPPPLHISLQ